MSNPARDRLKSSPPSVIGLKVPRPNLRTEPPPSGRDSDDEPSIDELSAEDVSDVPFDDEPTQNRPDPGPETAEAADFEDETVIYRVPDESLEQA